MPIERPPSPDDIRLYRIEILERELEQLRMSLHDEYLDKSQLMNEYVPRAEHLARESKELAQARDRREWPLVIATVFAAVAAIVNAVSGLH